MMAESKAFASLSPRLLARKGSARPAMRPQVAPLVDFPSATPHSIHEDLGWNDMGETAEARVVPISGHDAGSAVTPEVLVRRKMLARAIAGSGARAANANGSVAEKGKRAAFTLRIDPERHFKLRLACSVTQRSAQQLLTEALDKVLGQLPEIQPTTSKSGKRR